MGVGSSERPRLRGWARPEQRPVVGDVEAEGDGAGRDSRRAEEMTQGAVWRVDARAARPAVGLDVRRGMSPGGVEAGVRQRGRRRQEELQGGSEEPEDARPQGALRYADHADVRTSLRSATAPTRTTPYMHTISGPVGKSPASDSHRPRIEASAPEPQEM